MNKDQQLPHDLAHRLRLLEVLDRITQVSLASENMEDVLSGVLDLVLEVFNADRAWFLYPCDPDAPSWGVPMERTRPGWPGLSALGEDIPTNRDTAEIFGELLRANDTIQYVPHTDHPVPQFIVEQFSVKSQLMIALRPKIGKAWVFGLHHCASEVMHDKEGLLLFSAIAHRISDSLSSLISIRQLRASEERHRRIIETTQEGFGEIDSSGRIVSANKRCAEMFGYTPDEFIGLNIVEDLLFPIDRENMLERLDRRRRGEADSYEQRLRAKDGEALWAIVSATPIKDESGAVHGSFAMLTDITERKQAETEREIALRKVERAQAMLQTVLDSTPDWIFAKDKNYRFLFVNRSFAASMGCTPQDMVGRTDTDFWSVELCNGDPARGIRGFHTDDDAAIAGNLIHNPSDPATLSDGKLHIFDTLKLPLLDADGHCYGVLGYARDVTERMDAERIRFSEALLRQTQYLAIIGSWQFNVPRNKLVWSDETYRIFGIPVGTPLDYEHFLELAHSDDRSLVDSAWQAALKGAPYRIQHRIVVDGETRWVEERAQLDFDAQGNLYSCTGSVQDITERKQAEMALHESESRWRSLTQNSPDHIIMIDPEETIRYINHTVPDLTPEDVVGTPITGYLPEKYRPIAHACYQRVLDSGLPDRYETEYCDAEGNIHYFEARVGPVKVQDQVTALIVSARDITERKQAEAELRIAATAFESQESLMITNADSVILRVNQAFTEITGYTAEEAVGQTPRLLKSGRHNADFYRAMWKILLRTGAWQGEIWDRRKNGEVYPAWLTITAVKGADGVTTHYVGAHLDITERKVAEEEIKNLAFYDSLTRLPNRQLLLDRLLQALVSCARNNREGALLFIDLDNFKTLNDTLGHDIGDLLLQQVAQRLTSCVREGDTVARLGGDEFVLLLVDLGEHALEAAAQTEAIGEKIIATLNQPYQLASYEYHCTPSIGATLFSNHAQSQEELLKQADIAMYQAKKAGRNTLRFFDPQMQDIINARAVLENELRKALDNRQFQLYYQIQVDSSHRPLGAEALIRWIHPGRGLVFPAQFISLAEETGLILPIGQWVLETACAQIKAWQQDAITRDLVLAVNVSANQFHKAGFRAQVQAAVQRHAINPMLLKLELTESLMLENIEDTIATMNALNEIGVQFSLDDFGTGYSSLQYLRKLPLDQLKIDQSFISDIATNINDETIVHTIIAMAQSLNLDVIAEGVETEEQRQLLLNNGCTHYQGYLFGKPAPIEQFEALLKQG